MLNQVDSSLNYCDFGTCVVWLFGIWRNECSYYCGFFIGLDSWLYNHAPVRLVRCLLYLIFEHGWIHFKLLLIKLYHVLTKWKYLQVTLRILISIVEPGRADLVKLCSVWLKIIYWLFASKSSCKWSKHQRERREVFVYIWK